MEDPKINKIKTWLGSGSINVFGLPFAGKDTHCRELSTLLGGPDISGGQIIRVDESLKHIKAHVSSGALAPTEDYLNLIRPYFSKVEFAGKPLILNSVGRWHGEEKQIMEAAAKSGHPIKAVIYLDITEGEAMHRWEMAQNLQDRGQREDDARHVIQTRFTEFREKTMPVLDFYQNFGLLVKINGMEERSIVLQNIVDNLIKFKDLT